MSAQLSSKDLLKLKWILGNLLALLALWASMSLSGSALFIVLPVGGLILLSILFPAIPGRFIMPKMRWVVGMVLFFAAIDFVLNVPNFLNPLIRLVIFLLMIRACSYRTRREDMQILLLALFLMVLSGVLTVSLLFGAQMIIFSPLAMMFLFFVNLAEDSKDDLITVQDWKGFALRRFITRVANSIDRTFMLLSAALFVVLVAISSMIFVLIPRFQIDQNIPFLQAQSQAKAGFSENIEFGDVTEIAEDNSVAVRLDPPSREMIPNNPYWRMLVADEYSEGVFRVSQGSRDRRFTEFPSRPSAEYWLNFSGRLNDENQPMQVGVWTFYMEGNISRYLPNLGPCLKVRFPKEVRMYANKGTHTYNTDLVSNSVFSYQLEAMVDTRRLAPHRSEKPILQGSQPVIESPDSDVMKAVEFPMTQLAVPLFPVDVEILEEFVDEIRGESIELSAEEYADRVIAWLERRHRYSLKPRYGEGVGDPLIRWMQSRGGGHCELFAGAMTLLCRAAGIPARVVVGFNGGSWNPLEEYFIIRNRNAHAWVEIFDGDAWVRFDPTPNAQATDLRAANGLVSIIEEEAGWDAWVDSLRIVWYRQIVNFDQASQEALVSVFVDSFRATLDSFGDKLKNFAEHIKTTWTQLLEENTWWRPLLIGLCIIGLLIIALRRRAQLFWQVQKMRLWMRGEADVYAPLRRQAGKWMDRLRSAGDPERSGISEALTKLEEIRYGPAPDKLEPFKVFSEAKRLARAS